jgi:hypothetical protein
MTSRGKTKGVEAVARSVDAESLNKGGCEGCNLQLWRFAVIINFYFVIIVFNQNYY